MENMENNKKSQCKLDKRIFMKWLRAKALSPEFWINIALFFAILFVLTLFAVFASRLFDTTSQISLLDVVEEVLVPMLTAVGFSVGFCLTIRGTRSIERQAKVARDDVKLRKRELNNNLAIQNDNKYKEDLRALNEGGIMAIDAIENIKNKVKDLKDTKDDINVLQRYVNILCSFLRFNTVSPGMSIYDIDEQWIGNNRKIENWVTQEIIDLLYPSQERNAKKGRSKEECDKNPFFNYRERLHMDLSLCDLSKINFSKREVLNTDFGGSAMHGAMMHDAIFKECQFWGTYLQSANLTRSQFLGCKFGGAKMVWTNLCEATFINCGFDGADMSCALLSQARFEGEPHFNQTILDGADIYIGKKEEEQKEPKIFENPALLNWGSACFTFIHPLQGETAVETMLIDTFENTYDNPCNRLERYIRYLNILRLGRCEGMERWTTCSVEDVRGKKKKLLELCHKALKYAIVEDSTRLYPENYEKWTQKIKKLISEVESDKKDYERGES